MFWLSDAAIWFFGPESPLRIDFEYLEDDLEFLKAWKDDEITTKCLTIEGKVITLWLFCPFDVE